MQQYFKDQTELTEYLRNKEYKNPEVKARHVFRVEKGPVTKSTLEKFKPGWESDFESFTDSSKPITLLMDEAEYYSDEFSWALNNTAINIRKRIFDTDKAPFENYDDAIKWIDSIHEDYFKNYGKYAPKIVLFEEKFNELKSLVRQNKAIGDLQRPYKELPYKTEVLENGLLAHISANVEISKKLSLLEFEISQLSIIFRIDKFDALKLVLSDIKPKIKRYEVLKMPGIREQIVIKINVADLSFKEIKEIYETYRNARGVQKQKVMGDWQKYLLELVNEVGLPPQSKGKTVYWTKVMDEWNKRYENIKTYTDWRALDKAYKNIKDKLKRV